VTEIADPTPLAASGTGACGILANLGEVTRMPDLRERSVTGADADGPIDHAAADGSGPPPGTRDIGPSTPVPSSRFPTGRLAPVPDRC
jgi:NADPH:quinone reductase